MLALPHTNSWGFIYSNEGGALNTSTAGTGITPGTSDSEGSFVEIGPDASITTDIYYASLLFHTGSTSGQAKNHFFDVAYDPTGGTTYDRFLFQDFACGAAAPHSSYQGIYRHIHFPCKVPAGSAIAIRAQGSNATAGSVRCIASFYGKPSRPELWRPAAYSETLGVSSGTLGTSFTPGNASWGSWTSLGTTAKKHFWAQLGVQIDNNTYLGHATHVQLGIGDGTNMNVICDYQVWTASLETLADTPQNPCTWEIPAGAELWVRANNSTSPITGYNATCVLFGG